MASRRRSSILKIQTSARAPLSALDFHPQSPTENGPRSRRVSFSRKKGVAEFRVDEATTSLKHFYEVPNNNTMDSSQNETDPNEVMSNEDFEKSLLKCSEQIHNQFVSLGQGDGNSGEIFVLEDNANTGVLNVTNVDINIMREIEELDGLEVGGIEQVAVPGDLCTSIHISEITIRQNPIEIDENDEVLNMMREFEESDDFQDVNRVGAIIDTNGNKRVVEVDILTDLLSETICPPKRVVRSLQSQTLDLIDEAFGVDKENIKYESVPKHNSENIPILGSPLISYEPLLPTRKTMSRVPQVAIHDKENIPVLGLKRSYSGVTEGVNKKSVKVTGEDVDNIPCDVSITDVINSNMIVQDRQILNRFNDDLGKASQKIEVFNEFELLPDMSLTRGDLNVLSNKVKESGLTMVADTNYAIGDVSITQAVNCNVTNLIKDLGTTNVFNKSDSFGNMSLTQAVIRENDPKLVEDSGKIIYLNKDDCMSITQEINHAPNFIKNTGNNIVFNKNTPFADMSPMQAVTPNLVPNLIKDSRKTIVFNKEEKFCDMSLTQAVVHNNAPNLVKDSRKTLIYNKDEEFSNMPLSQAVVYDNIPKLDKEARKTIVFTKDDSCGNMSLTQAIDHKVIPNVVKDTGKTIVFNKDDELGDMSITHAINRNEISNLVEESRKTIVFNKDDELGDMSITHAINRNEISNLVKESRKTIVFNKNEEFGNMSLTQAIDHKVIPNVVKDTGKTIVFNKDDELGDMSITHAINRNEISNLVEESRKTIVFNKDDELGDMSITHAINRNEISNLVKESRKTIVFNKNEEFSNMSLTQAIVRNSIQNLIKDARTTIVFSKDDSCGNMSITQAIDHNEIPNIDKDAGKTIVFNKDDELGDMSITHPINRNEISNIAKESRKFSINILDARKTIISTKDDSCGNMSITQAIDHNEIPNIVKDTRKTIVFNKDDELGDMSITHAINRNEISNLVEESRKTIVSNKCDELDMSLILAVPMMVDPKLDQEARKTIVFNEDNSCGNMSITQAINRNDVPNSMEALRRTTVFNTDDLGEISLSQAIDPKLDKQPRKSTVFNKDQSVGDISLQAAMSWDTVAQSPNNDKELLIQNNSHADTSNMKAIPILARANLNKESRKIIVNADDPYEDKSLLNKSRKTIIVDEHDSLDNILNEIQNFAKPIRKSTEFNEDNVPMTQSASLSQVKNLSQESPKIILNEHDPIENAHVHNVHSHVSLTLPEDLQMTANVNYDDSVGNFVIPEPTPIKEIRKSVKLDEIPTMHSLEMLIENSQSRKTDNVMNINEIDSDIHRTNVYEDEKDEIINRNDEITIQSMRILESNLPETICNLKKNYSINNANSNCVKNGNETDSAPISKNEQIMESETTHLTKELKSTEIAELSTNDFQKVYDRRKTYDISDQKQNVSAVHLDGSNNRDSGNVFINTTFEKNPTSSAMKAKNRRCTYTVKSASLMDMDCNGKYVDEDLESDLDQLRNQVSLIEDTSAALIDTSAESLKSGSSEIVSKEVGAAAEQERLTPEMLAFAAKEAAVLEELKASKERWRKAMERLKTDRGKPVVKERTAIRKKVWKSFKLPAPVVNEEVIKAPTVQAKNEVLDGFNIEKEISKLDCLRTHCNSHEVENYPWRFYFLNSKLLLSVEPERASHQDSTNVDPESAILDVRVELTDENHAASLEASRLLYRRVLIKLLDAQALKANYPLVKNVSGILQRVCEGVASVVTWRREMLKSKLNYAYKMDNDFGLTWNIANCHVRTVWNLKTQMVLDDLPSGFPRLACLSVTKVSGNTEATIEELKAALLNVKPSWSAVTDSVKVMSKLLIAKRRSRPEEDFLD